MVELHVALSGQGHLYEQIYHSIRSEIMEGRLRVGEQLPSARLLAQFLSVSRSTVDLAYEQLSSEGYIEARARRGYYVCELQQGMGATDLSETLREVRDSSGDVADQSKTPAISIDFSPRHIDMEAFPYAAWRRIQRSVLVGERRELFALGDPQGDRGLRETIARYLALARGVVCSEDQIVLGAGSDHLLLILSRMLGRRLVAMEPLSYVRAAQVLSGQGMRLVTTGMDEGGMLPGGLSESGAELIYVMPSHQYPTGVVMPVGRRQELLSWAREAPAGALRYIIEDDYDSEFRYRGRPIPSLHSQDGGRHVIYMGTFSKTIAPAIRVSFMVLPRTLLQCWQESCRSLTCAVSRIDQAVLEEFISDGAFGRHLSRMRRSYRVRHDALLEALDTMREAFTISGEDAGLHLLLSERGCGDMSPSEVTDRELELARLAQEAGVRVYPLRDSLITRLYAKKEEDPSLPGSLPHILRSPTIVLGFAALTPGELADGVSRLERAWSRPL